MNPNSETVVTVILIFATVFVFILSGPNAILGHWKFRGVAKAGVAGLTLCSIAALANDVGGRL